MLVDKWIKFIIQIIYSDRSGGGQFFFYKILPFAFVIYSVRATFGIADKKGTLLSAIDVYAQGNVTNDGPDPVSRLRKMQILI